MTEPLSVFFNGLIGVFLAMTALYAVIRLISFVADRVATKED